MGGDEILNEITRGAACGAGKKRRKQSGTALREGRGGRKQETPPAGGIRQAAGARKWEGTVRRRDASGCGFGDSPLEEGGSRRFIICEWFLHRAIAGGGLRGGLT